jgi:hypothetical protein
MIITSSTSSQWMHLHFGWIQRRIILKTLGNNKQQTMEGGPVIFFIGEFSPIFDMKQNNFDLCK